MHLSSLLAFAAAAPLLAAAAPPVQLAPATKWVLHYAEDSCRLIRTFGEADRRIVLLFERASPQSPMSMVAIGKPLETPLKTAPVYARFLPDAHFTFTGEAARGAERKEPAVLFGGVDFLARTEAERSAIQKTGEEREPVDLAIVKAFRAESQANAAKATALEIIARADHPVVLQTGSMGLANKMLEECTRNQLRDWGVDPELEDRIVLPVSTRNAGSWLGPEDYPRETLDRGEQSMLQIRLLVDANGRVTKCTVLSHVKAPEFRKVVCNRATKRRFQPAELADGTKVPSYYTQTIHFRIRG